MNDETERPPVEYRITITKIETRQTTRQGDFVVLERTPRTEKDFNAEIAKTYGSEDEFLRKNPLKETRGYAPSYTTTKEVEVELLKQTVTNLDLAAVIRAVNYL